MIRADRIAETTLSTGIGSYALAGAILGFSTFAAVCAIGDAVEYFAEAIDANGLLTGDFEVGLGQFAAGNALSRTTIYSSSNANNPVNWPAGSKRIAVTLSAEAMNNLPVSAKQAAADAAVLSQARTYADGLVTGLGGGVISNSLPVVNAATRLIQTQKIMAQMALRGQI